MGHPLDDERFRKEAGKDPFRLAVHNGQIVNVCPRLQGIQGSLGNCHIYKIIARIVEIIRIDHFRGIGSLLDGKTTLSAWVSL